MRICCHSKNHQKWISRYRFTISGHPELNMSKQKKNEKKNNLLGSKKSLYEGGGGIKFKRKSHKSSHNNFRKKVKKNNQGRMAHNFFLQIKGVDLPPPPNFGFSF